MLHRTVRPALAILVAALVAVVTALGAGTASGLAGSDNPDAGPPYDFITELTSKHFIPLRNQVMLTRTKLGYRFRSGGQDSHLVVTQVRRGLRFVDTGTQRFKKLSRACRRQKVRRGVAAVCRVPRGVTARRPLLVEVWPRLGNDFTDGSSLPQTFALAVLGDKGRDVTRLGAGPDFFNGHSPRDRVSGGAGNDWIRAGSGNDPVWGGPGDDYLVGMDGDDTMYGGSGDDRVGGMNGDDRLYGQEGEDFILCGTGRDDTKVDEYDRVMRDCESVDHR